MSDSVDNLLLGTVKFRDEAQGYAIIAPQDGGADAVVKLDMIASTSGDPIDPGVQVCFEQAMLHMPTDPLDIVSIGLRPRVSIGAGDAGFLGERVRVIAGSDPHAISYLSVPGLDPDYAALVSRVSLLEDRGDRQDRAIEALGAMQVEASAEMPTDTASLAVDDVTAEQEAATEPYWPSVVPLEVKPVVPEGLSWLVDATLAGPKGGRDYYAQGALLEFGAFVRARRGLRAMTLEDLAQKVGSSVPQLSHIERGTGKRGPSLDLIARILWALGARFDFGAGEQCDVAGE